MASLCECGCGMETLPYIKTDSRIGAVKGQPARFIKGHSNRRGGTSVSWDLSSVKVDESHRGLLSMHKWYVFAPDGKKQYVAARINGKNVYLHRFLTGAPKGIEVDHINGDGLDNRLDNLRLATRQQNCVNRPPKPNTTSRFKGVSWDKSTSKWVAVIHQNRKKTVIGYFIDEKEAAQEYNKEAISRYGEFAYINDV